VRRVPGGAVLFVAVSAILLVGVGMVVSCAANAQEPPGPPTQRELDLARERDRAKRYADRLERVVQRQTTRAEKNERRLRRARWTFERSLGTSPIGNHWLESAFQCIYRYERGPGGWGTATGNGYEGGLQFDRSFQRSHGADYLRAFGPAYNWPRSVQIAVAIDAWTTRGFGPWPTTRRSCGL
jgi:Transglycosylase-like domain